MPEDPEELRELEKSWGLEEWLHRWERRLAIIPRPHGFLVAEPRPLTWSGGWTLYYARKIGLTTVEAARILASRLGASRYDYYGLKDAHAIAFQHIALYKPTAKPHHLDAGPRLEAWLVADGVSRPVRGMHLWNSFRIILEPLDGAALECRSGHSFPNYYGPQRFGVCTSAQSHTIGLLLARGQEDEAARLYSAGGSRRIPRFARRIALEALQSYIWNRALSAALRRGLISSARLPRAALSCPSVAGTIRVPALPLPSPRRRGPDWWDRLVDSVLDRLGLARDMLRGLEPRLRPAIARPCTYRCEKRGGSVMHVFTLPRGVYATIYLREAYYVYWPGECPGKSLVYN